MHCRHLLLALLTATSLHAAAPPPELTALQQQYEKAFAEKVTTVHQANIAALKAKFTAALDGAATQAKSAGQLQTVLAIQADKQLVGSNQDLPDDDEKTPDALKRLHIIYRDQLAKINEQRSANANALLTPYTARLKELEATLTKADRVEEAKAVLDYREGLSVDSPPVATVKTDAKPEASPLAKPPRTFPPADDRKAAEWLIELGCGLGMHYKVDGKEFFSAPKDSKLPDGDFQLTFVLINFQLQPKKKYKNLEPLAGLQHLRELQLNNMPLTDADTEVWVSMPKLAKLWISQTKTKFSGSNLHLLAGLPELETLAIRSTNINSKGVAAISMLPKLTDLGLIETDITDKDLPALGKMTGLRKLFLNHTNTSIEGLSKLVQLTGLTDFGWTPSSKHAKADFQKMATLFPMLKAFRLSGHQRLAVEDISALGALAGLESISLSGEMNNKATYTALAALPTLKKIDTQYMGDITPNALAPLATSPSLESFTVDSGDKLNGACIQHLIKIVTLKTVKLGRCPDVKPADIDAFKQERPDVAITLN